MDRYDTDPDGQATCYPIHENELDLWNVKFCDKKYFCGTFTNQTIFSFLDVPIKHVQEKKEICKRKRTFFYLNFFSIATLKKLR